MQGENATYILKEGSRFEGTMKADHFYDGTYTDVSGSRFTGIFDEKGQPKTGTWYDKNGVKIEDVG